MEQNLNQEKQDMYICPNCGKETPNTGKFCGFCGALTQNSSAPQNGNSTSDTKKKKKKRLFIIFGCIISIIMLIVVFVNVCFHDWVPATCTKPEICSKCDKERGEALGHVWGEATCIKAKTCEVCGTTDGEALGHSISNWIIIKESTCTEKGVREGKCNICNETFKESIDLKEHIAGEWEITKEPTMSESGEKNLKCTVCGEVFKTETFDLPPEKIEENYKASCKTYSYNEIARYPEKYEGNYAKFYGKVLQVMQQTYGNTIYYNLRIGTGGSYYYDNVVYVVYYADKDDARILEDDMITIYGILEGEYTYETVRGDEITIPKMDVEYIS